MVRRPIPSWYIKACGGRVLFSSRISKTLSSTAPSSAVNRASNLIATAVWQRRDLDVNVDYVLTAAQGDALHRRHVGIVAPPRDRNVVALRRRVIGRIEIEPSKTRAKHRHPCVRSLCAGCIGTAAQITADVAGRQSQRAQARDHDVREILAYALT